MGSRVGSFCDMAAMAIVFTGVSGYLVAAEEMATRSAQTPEGYAAFSWLFPVNIAPFSSKTHAPTLNPEYGAYAFAAASRAFITTSLSSLSSSESESYSSSDGGGGSLSLFYIFFPQPQPWPQPIFLTFVQTRYP